MSVHIQPVTRRQFITSAIAATAGVSLLGCHTPSRNNADSERYCFLADTHIMADPAATARGITMSDHLRQIVGEIVNREATPQGVIINGDLATDGSPPRAADYRQLAKLISPMVESGIAMHFTMGNCDRRNLFAETLQGVLPNGTTIDERLVGILTTRHANIFLLDSLHNTQRTITKGSLGKAQMDWLSRSLDRHRKKPAIVVGHHHINGTMGNSKLWSEGGLIDSGALHQVLRNHKNVHAYVCGHTHEWKQGELDHLHLVNLPTTAYIFDPNQPRGWVDLEMTSDGARWTLNALNKDHPQHGQEIFQRWL